MQIAHVIAQRSKDPSTQAGAVIVDQRHVVVGLGYNGWPRGIEPEALPWARDTKALKYSDTKYAYVVHAEENAIYNTNKDPRGCILYATLFPCNECAKTIVQMGITEIVYESDKYHDDERWISARRLLDAAGVKCRQYSCQKETIKS